VRGVPLGVAQRALTKPFPLTPCDTEVPGAREIRSRSLGDDQSNTSGGTLLGALVGLAISFAWPTLAQQVDLDAARRAKAAAGREALTHAAAKVLAPVGSFTTFDVPGAVNGTFPSSINPAGAITGSYYDVNFVGHGFLRAKNGTLVSFDAPGRRYNRPFFPRNVCRQH
jgi:hypothetical protein